MSAQCVVNVLLKCGRDAVHHAWGNKCVSWPTWATKVRPELPHRDAPHLVPGQQRCVLGCSGRPCASWATGEQICMLGCLSTNCRPAVPALLLCFSHALCPDSENTKQTGTPAKHSLPCCCNACSSAAGMVLNKANKFLRAGSAQDHARCMVEAKERGSSGPSSSGFPASNGAIVEQFWISRRGGNANAGV